jgi:hypothetical protein
LLRERTIPVEDFSGAEKVDIGTENTWFWVMKIE